MRVRGDSEAASVSGKRRGVGAMGVEGWQGLRTGVRQEARE